MKDTITLSASEDTKTPMRELAQAMGLNRGGSGNLSALWQRIAQLVNEHTAATVAARLEGNGR